MRLLAAPLLFALVACGTPQLVSRRPAVPTMLVKDVAVLDVVKGRVIRGQDVRIRGETIVSIEPTREDATAARVLDGRGATLVPGLIDMHGHTGADSEPPWDDGLPNPEVNLQRYLYCGVTRVFDPGGMTSFVFDRRASIRTGELLGPHLYVAGPMFTASGGHPVPLFEENLSGLVETYVVETSVEEVDTATAAEEAVRELLDEHTPDFVKVVVDAIPKEAPQLRRDVLRAIVDTAKARGVRAVAHVGTTADAIEAAEAGVAAWIHVVYRERIDDAAIGRLAAFEIPMVPTLVVFDSYGRLGRAPRVATPLEREIVPADELAKFEQRPPDYTIEPALMATLDTMRDRGPDQRANVGRLHAAGVTMLVGTDAQAGVYHGAAMHRELRLMEDAGLSRAEVLRAATVNAARFLTQRDDPPFGVVAPGKVADLVLVEGDPLQDLGALAKIRTVLLAGRELIRRPVR